MRVHDFFLYSAVGMLSIASPGWQPDTILIMTVMGLGFTGGLFAMPLTYPNWNKGWALVALAATLQLGGECVARYLGLSVGVGFWYLCKTFAFCAAGFSVFFAVVTFHREPT